MKTDQNKQEDIKFRFLTKQITELTYKIQDLLTDVKDLKKQQKRRTND